MRDTSPDFKPKTPKEQALEARLGEPIDAVLRRLYVDQDLSQEQVADRLGVERKAVVRWMAKHGIPTRDRRKVAA